MPCLQNSKFSASPVVRRRDTETEGNLIQVIVKAKFVPGKPLMMKVESRKFIKDSRKELLAEATFDLLLSVQALQR